MLSCCKHLFAVSIIPEGRGDASPHSLGIGAGRSGERGRRPRRRDRALPPEPPPGAPWLRWVNLLSVAPAQRMVCIEHNPLSRRKFDHDISAYVANVNVNPQLLSNRLLCW